MTSTTTPNPTSTPVIEMSGVAVGAMRDLSNVVVEEVDWRVEAGDFWAVAGLQGTGKSDFLCMTAGLVGPVRGHYRCFGMEMPVYGDSQLAQRLRLGLVFDGGHLFNHATVRENISLPIRYHRNLTAGEANLEVEPLLEMMELQPWADSTPGNLGRNWHKRAGLARALALRPEVLLVDNPLGGLDLRHASWWLQFLGQLAAGHPWLQGRPLTLVVTTADLQPWRDLARQFAILRQRRLAVLGSWRQVEAANRELLQEVLTPDMNQV
jgi:ABC-type transporter Mla maintaining outer membrane lipid asymmetry ATPase subunit MlaF